MQQVRAEVLSPSLDSFEYLFERERTAWDPSFAADGNISAPLELSDNVMIQEARPRGGRGEWRLVKGLTQRAGAAKERDEAALKLASPESGAFILVSLRRRRRDAISGIDELV